MVEPWSEEEKRLASAVLKKIEHNNREWLTLLRTGEIPHAYPMPHDLYEMHRQTMKSVSSEAGIFDAQGQILLTQRPTREKDSGEPFPGLWHVPGTRHVANETNAEALKRLLRDEYGIMVDLRQVAYKEYAVARQMGISILHVGVVEDGIIEETPTRRWFDIHKLPEELLPEHRALITDLFAFVQLPQTKVAPQAL